MKLDDDPFLFHLEKENKEIGNKYSDDQCDVDVASVISYGQFFHRRTNSTNLKFDNESTYDHFNMSKCSFLKDLDEKTVLFSTESTAFCCDGKVDLNEEETNKGAKTGSNNNYFLYYFFSSISLVFFFIVIYLVREGKDNMNSSSNTNDSSTFSIFNFNQKIAFNPNLDAGRIMKYPPALYTFKLISPLIFSSFVALIITCSSMNIWNYTTVLLQRFSVPELSKSKFIIFLMMFLGLTTNVIFLIWSFSIDSILTEKNKMNKRISISYNTVIFLLFILLNLFYAMLSWLALERLMLQNHRLEKKLRDSVKLKFYILLSQFVLLFSQIFSIVTYNSYKMKKHEGNLTQYDKDFYGYIKLASLIIPYFMFIVNAFLNLTYYSEIIKMQDDVNIFIDRDYFIHNEETLYLI